MASNPYVSERQTSQEVAATNVDTDGSGDFSITFGDLRNIDSKGDVFAQAEGGYVVNVQSVSGNTVTFRVFESAGNAAALSATTSGTDVTAVNAKAFGQ